MQTDPLYRKAVEENEKAIQRYVSKNKNNPSERIASVLYTIPVIVHVMHTGGAVGTIYNPSDAQIQGAINYLNQVYNGTYPGTQGIGDIQIQFVLAAKDPSCNGTTGIERIDASGISGYSANGVSSNLGTTPGVDELLIKNLSRWNPYQYYNIWVVNKIDGKDGTSGQFIAGYAYFPGGQPTYDGTIMLATQMISGQKTLPHEIGHAFGLYHPFQGSADKNTCPANADCTTDGDHVCDTDPISYNQLGGVVDFSCRSGVNSCTGTNYSINTESNYMNYTNCYTLFTAGQKTRMLASATSPYRKSLTTSLALNSGYPIASYSSPIVASCTPTTSASGLGGSYAGILNIDINSRNLGSSIAMYDNGYVDGTASCLNLIQLVKGSTYTLTANVAGINEEQLRGWIDFNNNGVFDNVTEQIIFSSSIPSNSPNVSANFTIPATAVLNTMLRMRVIDDVSTIYGVPSISDGCTNPAYGQAEDYPVYITAGVLPVTLNNFTGVLRNNEAVLLWNTSMENNLKNFEIEKSTDGRNFVKTATVDAAKKSSSSQNYSYTDIDLSENNYYRLRMNDNNGVNRLSEVVLIHYKNMQQKVQVVNNPFSTYVDLRFGRAGSTVKLQLINTTGAIVSEKIVISPSGQLRWNLPVYLPVGNYIIKAIVDGEQFTSKIIRQ